MLFKIISTPQVICDDMAPEDILSLEILDAISKRIWLCPENHVIAILLEQIDRLLERKATATELHIELDQQGSLSGKMDDTAIAQLVFTKEKTTSSCQNRGKVYHPPSRDCFIGETLTSIRDLYIEQLDEVIIRALIGTFYDWYLRGDEDQKAQFKTLLDTNPVNAIYMPSMYDDELELFASKGTVLQRLVDMEPSQDYVDTYSGQHGHLVVVADGLGGCGPRSRDVAEAMVETMIQTYASRNAPIPDKETFFKLIIEGLSTAAEKLDDDIPEHVASTLMVIWITPVTGKVFVFQHGDCAAEFKPSPGSTCKGFKTMPTFGAEDSSTHWQEYADCLSAAELRTLRNHKRAAEAPDSALKGLSSAEDLGIFLERHRPFKGPMFQEYELFDPAEDSPQVLGELIAGTDGFFDNEIALTLTHVSQLVCKRALCGINRLQRLLEPAIYPSKNYLTREKEELEQAIAALEQEERDLQASPKSSSTAQRSFRILHELQKIQGRKDTIAERARVIETLLSKSAFYMHLGTLKSGLLDPHIAPETLNDALDTIITCLKQIEKTDGYEPAREDLRVEIETLLELQKQISPPNLSSANEG